jgi:hypothetical protein
MIGAIGCGLGKDDSRDFFFDFFFVVGMVDGRTTFPSRRLKESGAGGSETRPGIA